jgi:hypothetical protein
MRAFLLSLPTKLQSTFIVTTTIIAAFLIALALRQCFDLHELQINTDLIATVYQVLGTIYAILLTFTLWGVWQNFSNADSSVQNEAYTLLDLVHILESSATFANANFRKAALEYVELVLDHEWSSLKYITSDMINVHEASDCVSLNIIQIVQGMVPNGERENTLFGQTLTLLATWLDARRRRLLIARGNSAKALWPLLLTGAVTLFAFHGLFVAETVGIWAILLFGVALIIGLTFYLIFTLDCPFAGYPCIDPEPFKLALNILKKKAPEET